MQSKEDHVKKFLSLGHTRDDANLMASLEKLREREHDQEANGYCYNDVRARVSTVHAREDIAAILYYIRSLHDARRAGWASLTNFLLLLILVALWT